MQSWLEDELQSDLTVLEQTNRLRRLCAFSRNKTRLIANDGQSLIDACSNDYLGLSQHPKLIQRSIEWTRKCGTGATASRLISGTSPEYLAVEEKLAAFKGCEAALIFNSGFQANATVMQSLVAISTEQNFFFCDRLNHASLHQGCLTAGIRQIRFRHNDLNHLEDCLKKTANKIGRRFIITESVFSMDGDCANISALVQLADHYGAVLYVDEAHATGILGPNGRGVSALVPGQVDIVMGTLGKALGASGAYIAGSRRLIDMLITRCAGFIYSTALPPGVLGAIDAALDIVPTMEEERMRLKRYAQRLRIALKAQGLDTFASTTHIISVMLGEEQAALSAAAQFKSAGILVMAIRPPTVPVGTSRLRFSLSAALPEADMAQIEQAVSALSWT